MSIKKTNLLMMCKENNRYLLSGIRRQNSQIRCCEMQIFIAGVEGE
jgi:hypothetical protein